MNKRIIPDTRAYTAREVELMQKARSEGQTIGIAIGLFFGAVIASLMWIVTP